MDIANILIPVAVGAVDCFLGSVIGGITGKIIRQSVPNKVHQSDYSSKEEYEAAFRKEAEKAATAGTVVTVLCSAAVGAASTYVLYDVIPDATGSHHSGGNHNGGNNSSTSTSSESTTTTVDPDVAEVAGE